MVKIERLAVKIENGKHFCFYLFAFTVRFALFYYSTGNNFVIGTVWFSVKKVAENGFNLPVRFKINACCGRD
jgi:hypothetical protein